MSLKAIHAELEELHQQLLDMLANCGKSKKPKPPPECDRENIPDGYWMDSSCKLHRITRIFDHINLEAIASNVPRVEVTPGNGAGIARGGNGPKVKPKNVDALTWAYQLATWACQEKTVRKNVAYYRCLAVKGNTDATCKPLFNPVSCPEVEKLRDQLVARDAAKFEGQGGQFGGGGASGNF